MSATCHALLHSEVALLRYNIAPFKGIAAVNPAFVATEDDLVIASDECVASGRPAFKDK